MASIYYPPVEQTHNASMEAKLRLIHQIPYHNGTNDWVVHCINQLKSRVLAGTVSTELAVAAFNLLWDESIDKSITSSDRFYTTLEIVLMLLRRDCPELQKQIILSAIEHPKSHYATALETYKKYYGDVMLKTQ